MALGFILLASCGLEEWTGIVYPDRSNLFEEVRIGVFATLEACRDAALATIDDRAWSASADYECGLNCRPFNEGSDLLICDETLR